MHRINEQFLLQVRHAIANNLPVVALESTIISHGMPYPRNVQVARNVEALIRSVGAIPATCAIINGELPCITHLRGYGMIRKMKT